MAYKIDVRDGGAVEWHLTSDGARPVRNDSYTPRIYVAGPAAALDSLAADLATDPKVAALDREEWYLSLHADDREPVLCIDLERTREVAVLAREIRGVREPDAGLAPGSYRLFNVDFTPQFRYCLDTDTEPVPAREVRTVRLDLPERDRAREDPSTLRLDGDRLGTEPAAVLRALRERLAARDPDVLVLDSGELVPLLCDAAAALGLDEFRLGRRPGYDRLAGANTYESYGRTGHSPARYDVPGRAIVARDNSFLWPKAKLAGLLELVQWSWKPLQETAWASIGTSFTAMQIREALDRGVLVPWNKWEPEAFKRVETLHAADRGGHTVAPDTGLHEGVVEVDFSSMYPKIMCEFNVSPETVGCACHADREDVPGLGYAICDDRGFLVDVLEPLVAQRDTVKAALATDGDDADRGRLEHRSEALKWVLVTCFGYQGYRNAKMGRIECHEAINAFAREILLDAKATLERHGWRVVHGIVDSLWVQPRDDPTPIEAVCATVTDDVGIRLEHEADYDWVAFVPRRDGREAGALNRYFGSVAGEDEFKVRGIETRQRSTPAYVETCQEALLTVLDEYREPAPVVDRLQRQLRDLRDGGVPPADLVVTKRASKPVDDYTRRTHTVGALERARRHGLDRSPGQSVRYVVVDDDARRTRERVRLPFEDPDGYDAAFYSEQLIRAAESVVSPLGWDRTRIRRHLRSGRDAGLAAFE